MATPMLCLLVSLSALSPGWAQEPPPPPPVPQPSPTAGPVSPEDEARARLLFDNGERLYDEGRYEQAIVAFQEAYALSRRPALLFNMANAYERLGRLKDAIEALNTFRIHAAADQQPVLSARVQALEERLAEERAHELAANATVEDLGPLELLDGPPPTPARRSPAPWVVTGVGAALAVGGGAVAGTTWMVSRQQRDPEQWAAIRPVNNVAFGSALAGVTLGFTGIAWGLSRGP